MATFDFISGEEFRESLENDYRELNAAYQAGAWKAVHVLAGSIMEAILIDYLVASKYKDMPEADILKMDLNAAIIACKGEGILSERTEKLSHVIRSYRNLIHAGRLIRLGERADEQGARIAQSLVEIVVAEVAASRKEKYGYTAEQVATKIQRDSGTISIIQHILRNTRDFEIERLLLEVIPQKYLQLGDLDEPVGPALSSLGKCFRAIFKVASTDIKKKVTRRFVTILKEESSFVVRAYQTRFFHVKDLEFLSSDESQLVKQYLISYLQDGVTQADLVELDGIGEFLTPKEAGQLYSFIDRSINSNGHKSVSLDQVVGFYNREYKEMDIKVRIELKEYLQFSAHEIENALTNLFRGIEQYEHMWLKEKEAYATEK